MVMSYGVPLVLTIISRDTLVRAGDEHENGTVAAVIPHVEDRQTLSLLCRLVIARRALGFRNFHDFHELYTYALEFCVV